MIEETDDLVESVARAICYANGDNPDDFVYPVKTMPLTHSGYTIMSVDVKLVQNWTIFISQARYAIRAVNSYCEHAEKRTIVEYLWNSSTKPDKRTLGEILKG